MQRGLNDSVEPDRSSKGPDVDDREHIDDPTEHPIGMEDEDDPLRVGRTDAGGDGLTGKDRPDGLVQTDDIVDDADDEFEVDQPDVLEPIESGEAG
jgi:hypothetical protein